MVKNLLVLFCFLTTCFSFASSSSRGDLNPDLFRMDDYSNWNIVEDHLIKTGQRKAHVDYYNLNQVKNLYITRGFEIYKGLQSLYNSKKAVLKKIGHIVPSLHVKLAPDDLPSTVGGIVSGLLGFLIPFNWFKWLEAKQFYDARRYDFLNTVLDKQSVAEVMYYKIHLLKSEYEITTFFKNKVEVMVDHFREDLETDPEGGGINKLVLGLFEGLVVELNSLVFESRRSALDTLPSLATEIGLSKNSGQLDIKKLSLPEVETLSYLDKDKLVKIAKDESLELKHLFYLLKGAKYTLAASSSSFFSGSDQGEDFRSFGLSFGLDRIADIQVSRSNLIRIKIQMRIAKSIIDQTVSSLVFLYNESIRDYKTIVGKNGDYAVVYRILKDTLEAHVENGGIQTDVHQVDFLFNTMKRMNFLKHNILIYKTLIDRYLVKSRLKQVMNSFPVTKELERLKIWAQKKDQTEVKKLRKKDKVKRFSNYKKIISKKTS